MSADPVVVWLVILILFLLAMTVRSFRFWYMDRKSRRAMQAIRRSTPIASEVGRCRICHEPHFLRQGLCEVCETFKAALWKAAAKGDRE